ncbi:unnamed protein product [Soboliphyme baturini]|uniref:Transmembrane protein n=1 Tax=Soboliphyme baturini TaxID=241478 RepID=A0A183J4R8_9BILA|nr:unnamed protein product [Soboliphyme baturini]
MSFAFILLGDYYNIYKTTKSDVGYFLAVFVIYAAIIMMVTIRMNFMLSATILSLLIGLLLLCVESFLNEGREVKIAASWILIFSSVCSLYIVAHIHLHDVYKRDVLPVGKPPVEVLHAWYCRHCSRR